MNNKISTIGHANIAFIKYWGRQDEKLFLPLNDNISMTLSGCATRVTAQLQPEAKEDRIVVKYFNKEAVELSKESIKARNIFEQIERIREQGKIRDKVLLWTESNFPADAGIASSASSFSAMTGALLLIYGQEDKFNDKQEFSRQIRLSGSASAVRSAYGGYAKLLAGHDHQSSYAVQLANENYWDLVDVIAVSSIREKKVSSSEGHELAKTSPYLKTRVKEMQPRIKALEKAIREKDFTMLGEAIEADCVSMHAVMMTSVPAIYYWTGTTMEVIHAVVDNRGKGLQSYFTIDAGANVHVICRKADARKVADMLESIPGVSFTIYNEAGPGVSVTKDHLF